MIVHDNTGGVYKVSKIGNKASGYTLDPQKYLAYSSVRWFLEWYSHICPSINVYLGLHTNYVCLEYVWFILCHAECTTRLSHPGKSSIHGRCRQKDSSNGDRISSWPFKTSMPGRDWCARCPCWVLYRRLCTCLVHGRFRGWILGCWASLVRCTASLCRCTRLLPSSMSPSSKLLEISLSLLAIFFLYLSWQLFTQHRISR